MKIAIMAFAILLSGCGYGERLENRYEDTFIKSSAQIKAEQDAADDMACRSYGAVPGSELYVQCRVGLVQARAVKNSAVSSGPTQCTSLALGGGLTSTHCN